MRAVHFSARCAKITKNLFVLTLYLHVYKNIIILIQVVRYVLTRSYRQYFMGPHQPINWHWVSIRKAHLTKTKSHKTKICDVSWFKFVWMLQAVEQQIVTDITEHSAIPWKALHYCTLKMEALRSSETSVTINRNGVTSEKPRMRDLYARIKWRFTFLRYGCA